MDLVKYVLLYKPFACVSTSNHINMLYKDLIQLGCL